MSSELEVEKRTSSTYVPLEHRESAKKWEADPKHHRMLLLVPLPLDVVVPCVIERDLNHMSIHTACGPERDPLTIICRKQISLAIILISIPFQIRLQILRLVP
jgi:hypothetical protein